jgi:hypothetical protein
MTDIDAEKMEENALMAKLALHKMFARIRADMFLSSFAESRKCLPSVINSLSESISNHDADGYLWWDILVLRELDQGDPQDPGRGRETVLGRFKLWSRESPECEKCDTVVGLDQGTTNVTWKIRQRVDCHGAQPLGYDIPRAMRQLH